MYPGDRSLGAPAGEVVNCRCTVVGVMVATPSAGGGQPPAVVQAALAGARPAGMIQMHGMSLAEDMQEVHFQGNRYLFTPGTRDALETTLKALAAQPLPATLRARTDRAVFTDQRNKDDAYWERVYNIPGFVSLATGGDGHVVVYRAQAISRPLLTHEMGHNLAKAIYGSTRFDYAAAVAAGEPPVSPYGAVDPVEDFAEAVLLCSKGKHVLRLYVEDPQQLKTRAPKKFRVIDGLMNEVG